MRTVLTDDNLVADPASPFNASIPKPKSPSTANSSELQRSNVALEQFACVAAHELQAPITTIIGYIHRLQRLHGQRLDTEAAESMSVIAATSDRMQALIQDVLAYSRIDGLAGRMVATSSRLALKCALLNLAGEIQESQAVITHGRLPMVRADAAQLTQLIQNLIHNAIKFRRAAAPLIDVSARRDGVFCHFSVKDNGIGICDGDAERVFNLFQRLHGNGQFAGSGIGLAVCKRVVELHGGRIWVASRLGEGATFHFTLPAESGAPEAHSAGPGHAKPF